MKKFLEKLKSIFLFWKKKKNEIVIENKEDETPIIEERSIEDVEEIIEEVENVIECEEPIDVEAVVSLNTDNVYLEEPKAIEEEKIEIIEEPKTTLKRITDKIEEKILVIKETVAKPTTEKVIGDVIFKKYEKGISVGSFGVVAIIDSYDGRIELGRSVKLNEYISNISPSTIASGRYGRVPREMKKPEVYFLELNSKEEVIKTYGTLNKSIYKTK